MLSESKLFWHCTHVAGNDFAGDGGGGNHAVYQAFLVGQVGKAGAVDLGHHLAVGKLAGVHSQDDVRFVQAGQGHKGVHFADAFLAQQLAVGRRRRG